MKKNALLFCLFFILITNVFSQSEVIPLAAGNEWSYVSKEYNENGTLKGASQTIINVLKDTTINYQGTSVKVFLWQAQDDSWKWLLKNEPDGLYCYGIKKPNRTDLEKTIQIKYPANASEKFTSTYNGFTIGKEIVLESKNAQVVTPAGTYSCYLYGSTYDSGLQYSQTYILPGKGIISLKHYFRGRLESEILLGSGTGFGTNLAPSAPQLIGPMNNLTIFSTTQTLSWSKCSDPEGTNIEYQVYMWKDFDPYKYIKSVYATTSNVVTAQIWGLEKGENYNWKIVASDGVNLVNSDIRYFQVNISATDVLENKIPTCVSLHQNYPNPFNPQTTIKYEIVETGYVSLAVYDILGNKLAQLVNEQKSPGIYEEIFRALELSSTIYFYELKVDGKSFTKKMSFVK